MSRLFAIVLLAFLALGDANAINTYGGSPNKSSSSAGKTAPAAAPKQAAPVAPAAPAPQKREAPRLGSMGMQVTNAPPPKIVPPPVKEQPKQQVATAPTPTAAPKPIPAPVPAPAPAESRKVVGAVTESGGTTHGNTGGVTINNVAAAGTHSENNGGGRSPSLLGTAAAAVGGAVVGNWLYDKFSSHPQQAVVQSVPVQQAAPAAATFDAGQVQAAGAQQTQAGTNYAPMPYQAHESSFSWWNVFGNIFAVLLLLAILAGCVYYGRKLWYSKISGAEDLPFDPLEMYIETHKAIGSGVAERLRPLVTNGMFGMMVGMLPDEPYIPTFNGLRYAISERLKDRISIEYFCEKESGLRVHETWNYVRKPEAWVLAGVTEHIPV